MSAVSPHTGGDTLAVLRDVDPVGTEWDALVDRGHGTPFMRPGWIAAWTAAWGHGRVRFLTLRRDGRLVALLPLCASPGSLRSATNEHTPDFALIAEDRDAADVLATALFSRHERLITLSPMDAARGDLDALRAASAATGRPLLVTLVARPPYLDLPRDWPTLERSLNRKTLSDLRRRRRRLEEKGRLSLEILDGRHELADALEEGFRLESSGWKAVRGTAIASQPRARAFYAEVARWAAARDMLRLVFLRLDGRAVAFEYGIEDRGVHYYVKGGFDPMYADYSPGRLLVHALLEQAVSDGVTRLEFLGTEERWKRTWARAVHEQVQVHTFPGDLRGLVHRALLGAYWRHARPLAKRALGWFRRR
jgi:CelD/BcsL family acetyltransferase involved in cellulose biosynthesis